MAEHKIHCPSCAQHLSVPEELAGQLIGCPSCNKPMSIPNFAHAFDEEEERIGESSSRKSPALIAGIVAGVLVVGAIGFFLLSGKDHSGDGQQTATINKTATPETNPETTAKTYATWEEYKAASQAEGWHYDIAEYIGDVPDEENFFMAKPFSGLLYTQQIGGKPVYLNPTIKTDFEAVMNLRVRPQHRIQGRQFPDLGDFAKQLRLEPSRTRYGNKATSLKGADEKVVENYFKQFDGIIGDLRKAAKRPKDFFPIAHENGANASMPHVSHLKGLAGLLHEAALFRLSRGEADVAMECVRLQFRLFEAAGGGGSLMDHLVRSAIGSIIVNTLNDGLHQDGWNEIHLAEWDKFINLDRNYLRQWERGMQGERLIFVRTIESQINGVDLLNDRSLQQAIEAAPRSLMEKDLIFYDSLLKKLIDHIRQARTNSRIDSDQFDALISESVTAAKQNVYVHSRMLAPALRGVLAKAGRLMNQFSAARLGIAIERYRRAKGTLPSGLSDLVTDYIGALPRDALTDKPLTWEHHGSLRYKIPVSDTDSQSWKYDGILAAIQAGDLGRLKAFAEKGWKITRPEGGSTQSPESNPNMAGMMPYGMMVPGMSSGPKTIDFSAPETEILSQQNALHHAVHSGNLELLQWLIEQGLDPNASASVWTPEKSNASMPGMMPGMMMPYGMGMGSSTQSVLEFATNERQTDMVKALRDAGASSVKKKTRRQQGNPLGMGMMPGMMPPGMGMNPFGMEGDSEEEIKAINERLAKDEPLNQYNDTGDTELMIAARAGDLDLAKRLLEKNANANLKVNLEPGDFGAGETALHIAAIRENKTMCKLLYNNGALLNVKDEKGFTPLDAILSNFDTGPDPFTGKMINPKMTRKGKATIAYLQSKGGKSMTAKQRADAWKANDPFMNMMMPGGMPPNPFMMPPEGNPYAAPKSRNSTSPKRR